MRRPYLLLACLVFAQPAACAPKWLKPVKAVAVQFLEHAGYGGGLYFAGAYAAGGPHPNWQAGIATAGAGAIGKELLGDWVNHKDKLVHDCPEHCVVVHIGEIITGALAGAGVKH